MGEREGWTWKERIEGKSPYHMPSQAWGGPCDEVTRASLKCIRENGKAYCFDEIEAYNKCKKQLSKDRLERENRKIFPAPTKQSTHLLKYRQTQLQQKPTDTNK